MKIRTIASALMLAATIAPATAGTLTICDEWTQATLTVQAAPTSKVHDRLLMLIEGDQNFVTTPVYCLGDSSYVVILNPVNLSLIRQNAWTHYKIYNPVTNLILNEGDIFHGPCLN